MNKIKRFLKMFLYSFVSKKTLIIIIIVLLLLLLNNKVFASIDFTYNNTDYSLPDYPDNTTYPYFITVIYSGSFWTYSSDTEIIYNTSGNTITSSSQHIQIYKYTNNSWIGYGWALSQSLRNTTILYANHDIYDTNGNIYFPSSVIPEPPEPIEPYLTDTLLNLSNLNISNIVVDSGNQDLVNDEIIFKLSTRPKGSPVGDTVYSTVLSPSSEFYNANGVNGAYYEIPVEIFKDFLTAGYELTYYLEWRLTETPAQRDNSEITVVYNPQAETVDDIELLNASLNSNFNKLNNTIINNFNTLSQQQQQMIVQQQEAVDTAKDTNQFLKNDNFDNGNLNLPTSQGEDITQDGINNIFTMIYNAFTSGEAPDIIVPIPFTGKSFTIQANFLRNILNGTQFTFISNIIELFWWYIISKFIVQDIAKKMNKIKSGDLENLENSNIKEEML